MQRVLPFVVAPALTLALTLAFGAQAQQSSYCSGGVVAVQFRTDLTQTPSTRATYRVELENKQATDRRLQITVLASFQDRPFAPVTLAARRTQWVTLGYQTILPGTRALRGEALENVLRISCV